VGGLNEITFRGSFWTSYHLRVNTETIHPSPACPLSQRERGDRASGGGEGNDTGLTGFGPHSLLLVDNCCVYVHIIAGIWAKINSLFVLFLLFNVYFSLNEELFAGEIWLKNSSKFPFFFQYGYGILRSLFKKRGYS
jgi:hypothetical protein